MSNSPLVISTIPVRQDSEGRYCLNDLHKASGSEEKHSPNRFIRISQTKELIAEINQTPNMAFGAVQTVRGGNNGGGTYTCKELVYAYAMWINASFSLKVIRAYDELATQQRDLPPPVIEKPSEYKKLPLRINRDFKTAQERLIHILKWTSKTQNQPLHDELMSIYDCMEFAQMQMKESAGLIEKATEHLNRWL